MCVMISEYLYMCDAGVRPNASIVEMPSTDDDVEPKAMEPEQLDAATEVLQH